MKLVELNSVTKQMLYDVQPKSVHFGTIRTDSECSKILGANFLIKGSTGIHYTRDKLLYDVDFSTEYDNVVSELNEAGSPGKEVCIFFVQKDGVQYDYVINFELSNNALNEADKETVKKFIKQLVIVSLFNGNDDAMDDVMQNLL